MTRTWHIIFTHHWCHDRRTEDNSCCKRFQLSHSPFSCVPSSMRKIKTDETQSDFKVETLAGSGITELLPPSERGRWNKCTFQTCSIFICGVRNWRSFLLWDTMRHPLQGNDKLFQAIYIQYGRISHTLTCFCFMRFWSSANSLNLMVSQWPTQGSTWGRQDSYFRATAFGNTQERSTGIVGLRLKTSHFNATNCLTLK